MFQFRNCLIPLAALVLAGIALLSPRPAQAVYGAADNAPAATLLIPYFEVDLGNTGGRDTLVAITNTSASAVLTNVVLWSDQGVATASFQVYLTGFDVQSFGVRDLLNGLLPRTASAGQDPSGTISPQGSYSQDINFASCNGVLPYSTGAVSSFPGPGATPPTPADLRAMLTGQASSVSYPGQCVGSSRGDNVARGYITIDSIVACTTRTPVDYDFELDHRNILAGEFYLVDPSIDSAVAIPAVQIESTPGGGGNGVYTFYGAYNGFDGSDGREPLPTTWRASVENQSSEMLVWRDPKVPGAPRACAGAPVYGALPIGDNSGISAFGTAASFHPITGGSAIAPNVSQRIPVSSTPFTGLPDGKLGSMNLSFNHAIPAAGGQPTADPAAASSYVIILRRPEGSGVFDIAVPAAALDTGRQATHAHPRQF